MRSLTVLTSDTHVLKGKKPEARCTGLAVRPEELEGITTSQGETVYVASERALPDGGVEVQIFISNALAGHDDSPVASFKAPPEPPFELPDGKHIIDLKYLAETNALAVILAGGDIVLVNLEEHLLPGQDKIEVVGSVDSGIKASAWSPDEELLVLVTGEDNLVEMTKTFDVLAESPLRTEEFGEDKPVNVGWGAQETQFHGSIGKAGRDAVAGLPAASTLSQAGTSAPPPSSDTHDQTIRISWRGDGAFFVISATFGVPRTNEHQRRLRFYSRTAVLQATSESTPGLEGCLAWQPSGSIIAASALNSTQVVFFERNGLRRYEFPLKDEKPEYESVIKQLAWSVDSLVLAVRLERQGIQDDRKRHCVQLWRRNNYHWYLKQTLFPAASDDAHPENLYWHPEKPLSIFIVMSGSIESKGMSWQTYAAQRSLPHDSGAVAVVDGSQILFTPFRYQNVPPPMSSMALRMPGDQTPTHIALSEEADVLGALTPDGAVHFWRWSAVRGKKPTNTHMGSFSVDGSERAITARQLAIVVDEGESQIAILAGDLGASSDCLILATASAQTSEAAQLVNFKVIEFSEGLTHLLAFKGQFYVQTRRGHILSADKQPIVSFPEPCMIVRPLTQEAFLALSDVGRLYLNEQVLATGCTSFAIGGDFLVYTTLQHEARFILLETLLANPEGAETAGAKAYTQALPAEGTSSTAVESHSRGDVKTGYARRVERGSRIVTIVPSSMSVVLQMPRGNLETIAPRPLVLQVVRGYLNNKEYREAFLVCRRHRIDLNILCDHDRNAFIEDLALFVDQVESTEYLNLFISGLKNENVTRTMYATLSPSKAISETSDSDKIDTICKRLRKYLESKDLIKYANSILTTHACQRPPDLESALRVITQVKAASQEAAEAAVKYIIFLADANTLFDVALGIYDFDLVLAVAQNSQKDPREYIPFLRELRAYDKYYQRFKIDDHLKRYSKALRNLSLAGEDRFDEALKYMQQHELYDDAVSIFASSPTQLKTVLDMRGDWLMKDARAHEAALSYLLAKQPRKAMIAHQRALTWVELFDIALQEKLTGDEIAQLADNVADGLKGKGRHAEAGRVLLEYGRNVKAAVYALSEGALFAEALRLTSLYAMSGLVVDIILPGAIDQKDRLAEEASEIKEQIQKQVSRLHELREKRLSDAAGFYGRLLPADGDDALDNVDMQTDAGTAATTAFTRYTAAAASTRAGTVKSGASRRTAKKQMKKAVTGAKGSIFEESYLLGSLARLASEGGRLAVLVSSTASLTRALIRLSTYSAVEASLGPEESLLEQAKTLEVEVATLVDYLSKAIDEVWDALGDAKVHDLDTALLADADPSKADLDLLKKPEKPKTAHFGHWKVGVLSLLYP